MKQVMQARKRLTRRSIQPLPVPNPMISEFRGTSCAPIMEYISFIRLCVMTIPGPENSKTHVSGRSLEVGEVFVDDCTLAGGRGRSIPEGMMPVKNEGRAELEACAPSCVRRFVGSRGYEDDSLRSARTTREVGSSWLISYLR